MDRKAWLLIVLEAAAGDSLSPAQLQKALFLVGQFATEAKDEAEAGNYYNFIKHLYGPFDRQIYFDAEALSLENLVAITPMPNRNWNTYRTTTHGQKAAQDLKEQLQPATWEYIKELISWVKKTSFSKLIKTVYRHFPEYKENSVFQV